MAEIWAKRKKDGKIITFKKHTEDLLNNLNKISAQLPEKLGNIEKNELFQLLKYACFFHDLGKVSPKFQKTLGNEEYYNELKELLDKDIRHNILSLFFINKEKVKKICQNDESLFSTFLSSIAFHHWRKDEIEYLFHLNDDLILVCEILLNGAGKELEEILKKELEEILKEHFKGFKINEEEAKNLISFDEHFARHIKEGGNLISVGIIPPYTLYFLPERLKMEASLKIDLNLWIFLSGFLMRLDHFSSFCEEEDLSLEIEKEIPEVELITKLSQKFGEEFWQKDLIANLKDKNVILIAPTGIGKTEFAFLWAEGEKFFYTLPLRVATNQIFERAGNYFNESINQEDPFINGNVGLLHSDADLYLFDKWENVKDTSDEGEILKIVELSRHFSLPLNISTGDQIFPSALKYPSYEKIYATLGYSKLIIDEVQAYDPRACAIVVKMIEDIVSLGGKFLLMTATLPGFVKEELENKNIKFEFIDLYEEKIKDITRHKIELKENDIEDDIGEIINKANEGKRVLVVLNTIKKAEAIYEKIKENFNGFLDLLHSRFTLNERKKKEKELEAEFKNPKTEDENYPKILVATQVVEASLDIDADYLFTEIAPIDSLIQRMGRVMRRVDLISGKIKGSNEEFKYKDFYKNEPNIIIYYQKEKNKKEKNKIKESGEGKVYEAELIQKAYEILKDKKEIREREKQNLVKEFYEKVENERKSEYLKEFYETLNILNSGYVSEKKEEAHEIFRKIYTIPVISEDKVVDIINKINESDGITWLWFKKEIIAEYVRNENLWEYKELKTLWEEINNKIEKPDEIKRKLKNYCSGIYIIKTPESSII
jgi:CRISPR-associated endonuclease/helicase Cas3